MNCGPIKLVMKGPANRCIRCAKYNILVPYKGDHINDDEPDRLICKECGTEYVIDMTNKEFEPLINPVQLNKFVKEFIEDEG